MSVLKLGLVASSTDETKQLVKLLEDSAVDIVYNINPENITDEHVDDGSLHVWLLCVDDESWHDAVDHLLDESEIPVYFSEPGTLAKQSHPDFWCTNLLNRLYEITGLAPSKAEDKNTSHLDNNDKDEKPQIDSVAAEQDLSITETSNSLNEQTPLSNSLNELESSAVSLPSDIAAELVSELESISPVLIESISDEKQNLADESEESSEINTDDFSIEENVAEVESLIEEETILNDLTLDELSLDDEFLENKDSTDLQLEVDNEFSLELDSEENIDSVDENVIDESVIDENIIDIQESLAFDEPDDSSELVIEAIEPEAEHTLELEPFDSTSEDALGVADFAIDEENDLEEVHSEFEQTAEMSLDTGLTLEEFPDQKPITGKASFTIDESDDISPQENNAAAESKAEVSFAAESVQDESYGLSLEEIEEETQKPDWLSNDSTEEQAADSYLNESNIDTQQLEENESHTEVEELEIDSLDNEFSLDNIDSVELAEQETAETLEESVEIVAESSEDYAFSIDELEVNEKQSELDKEELELISEEIEGELSHNEPTFYEHTIDELDNDDDLALESLTDVTLDSDVVQKMQIDSTSIQEIARRAVSHEKSDTTHDLPTETKKSVTNVNHESEFEVSAEHSATEEFEIPMLDETAFDIEFEEKDTPPKKAVRLSPCWVIGASLGGPAAVKRFLNCIPPDINASMIIAQHIDENFLPVLADILTSNSQFDVTIANGSNELKPGKVLLAPLKGKIVILQDGSMLIDHSQKWSAPYSPCINDVIESVSNVYGHLSGTIIFSGMGDDGLAGAKKLHQAGGKIWAQSMDTCANASMPEAIITNDLAEFIGSPEQLAEQMISVLNG